MVAGRTTFRLSHRWLHDKYWTNIEAATQISPKSVSVMELIKCNVSLQAEERHFRRHIPSGVRGKNSPAVSS